VPELRLQILPSISAGKGGFVPEFGLQILPSISAGKGGFVPELRLQIPPSISAGKGGFVPAFGLKLLSLQFLLGKSSLPLDDIQPETLTTELHQVYKLVYL
jgi:hypothetical protein